MTETVSARDGETPALSPLAAGQPLLQARTPHGSTLPATVAFVGAGRAAGALAVAVSAAGHPVVAIASRDPRRAADLAGRVAARPVASALSAVRAADLTFLTVPDGAVASVAAAVAASGTILRGRGVVHCSAGLGVDALAALRLTGAAVGSLHPLQALTGAESAPLLRGALMAVDADPTLLAPLRALAVELGGRPVELPAGARTLYHAAAVLTGSAPLVLLEAATELMVDAGLDRGTAEQGLLTLMEGAVVNARRLGPRQALTGPVVRGDSATVAAHLAALADHPDADQLYRAITRAALHLTSPMPPVTPEDMPCP